MPCLAYAQPLRQYTIVFLLSAAFFGWHMWSQQPLYLISIFLLDLSGGGQAKGTFTLQHHNGCSARNQPVPVPRPVGAAGPCAPLPAYFHSYVSVAIRAFPLL